MTSSFAWPNGKRIAVTVTVLLETWSGGKAAPYSIQTTSLKSGFVDHSGIAWGQYGGNEGIWRLMRIFLIASGCQVLFVLIPRAPSFTKLRSARRSNPAMKLPVTAISRINLWSTCSPKMSGH